MSIKQSERFAHVRDELTKIRRWLESIRTTDTALSIHTNTAYLDVTSALVEIRRAITCAEKLEAER